MESDTIVYIGYKKNKDIIVKSWINDGMMKLNDFLEESKIKYAIKFSE